MGFLCEGEGGAGVVVPLVLIGSGFSLCVNVFFLGCVPHLIIIGSSIPLRPPAAPPPSIILTEAGEGGGGRERTGGGD